jgi:4'-phosphopantetheinyl transferase
LSSNYVHVWRTTLDQPALRMQQLAQSLSDEEHMRAECFHFGQDRKRFVVGRGVLRTNCNRYLASIFEERTL